MGDKRQELERQLSRFNQSKAKIEQQLVRGRGNRKAATAYGQR